MNRTGLDAKALADSLREKAGDGSIAWALQPIQTDVLLDAADMLEENAKLREERDRWHVEQVHAFGNWRDAYKRAAELTAENIKLRRLCSDMHEALLSLGVDHCQACPRNGINDPRTKLTVCDGDECSIERDMRKLGIERAHDKR